MLGHVGSIGHVSSLKLKVVKDQHVENSVILVTAGHVLGSLHFMGSYNKHSCCL